MSTVPCFGWRKGFLSFDVSQLLYDIDMPIVFSLPDPFNDFLLLAKWVSKEYRQKYLFTLERHPHGLHPHSFQRLGSTYGGATLF